MSSSSKSKDYFHFNGVDYEDKKEYEIAKERFWNSYPSTVSFDYIFTFFENEVKAALITTNSSNKYTNKDLKDEMFKMLDHLLEKIYE